MRILVFVTLTLMLCTGLALAAEIKAPQLPSPNPTVTPPSPVPTWLDAVRAQRMARFEQMEKEREAAIQRIDEQTKARREASRNRALTPPHGSDPKLEQLRQQHQREREARDESLRKEFEQRMQDESHYFGYPPPFGLAYPWYYRGY